MAQMWFWFVGGNRYDGGGFQYFHMHGALNSEHVVLAAAAHPIICCDVESR
jgi:hypothetical protein